MNICALGTGYVGPVTGAVFVDLGNEVVRVDSDWQKLNTLRACRLRVCLDGELSPGSLRFGPEDLWRAGVPRSFCAAVLVKASPTIHLPQRGGGRGESCSSHRS